MIAAPLVPLIGTAVLLAAAPAALWLDRRPARALGWLVAVAMCGIAVPLALRFASRSMVHVFEAPAQGGAIPEVWVASPLLTGVLVVLAVVLPLGVVVRSGAVEGPIDGAAVGSVAGVGFATGMGASVLSPAWQPAVTAVVFVTALHAAAGALLGAGVGLTELASRRAWRTAAALAAFVAAATLFAGLALAGVACWRRWGAAGAGCNVALAVAAVAALAAVLAGSVAYERRVLERQLREEVELGVLPAWVVDVVPKVGRRIRSGWWPRRDERREIVRLLVTLAFRKRQLLALSDDRLRLYGLEVGRLRQRARAILAVERSPLADPESNA